MPPTRSPLGSAPSAEDSASPPAFQMLVLCILNFNEAIQGNVIWPFIPFLVASFWVASEEEIGLHVGWLASAFYVAQLLCVSAWARLSDRIGRRPVLLLGLLGTCASMTLFGLSTNYWMAFASRFLTGAMSGNIAISKVYMGEISNARNQAKAFSWLSLTWGLGTVLAPALGGYLADPAKQYPGTWLGSQPLVIAYPYILPALVSSAFSIFAFALGYAFLPETSAWLAKRDERAAAQRAPAVDAEGLEIEIEDGEGGEEETAPMMRREEVGARKPPVAPSRRARAGASREGSRTEPEARSRAGSIAAPASDGLRSRAGSAAGSHASREPTTDEELEEEDVDLGTGGGSSKALVLGSAELGSPGPGKHVAVATAAASLDRPKAEGASSGPPPLPPNASAWALLSDPGVGCSILSYALLSLAQIIFDELQPVFCREGPAQGGLSWSSAQVGEMQIVQGAVQMTMQLFVFARLAGAYDLTTIFAHGMWPLIPLFAAWPALARLAPWPMALRLTMAVGLGIKALTMTCAFTSVMLLINNSARGTHLSDVTGTAQAVASLVRTVGPTVGGGLYSATVGAAGIGLDVTGRLHLVYGCIAAICAVCWLTVFRIPRFCNAPQTKAAPPVAQAVEGKAAVGAEGKQPAE